MKRNIILLLSLFLLVCFNASSQDKKSTYAIAFYNVENLFDTERDDTIFDEDFTPKGTNEWTNEKYQKKLRKLSEVITKLGKEYCSEGPAILGLAEVENRRVLEDLVVTEGIAEMGYDIVHYDSPDRRGIDVALLYNPKLFEVISSRVYPFNHSDTNFKSRDQLLVSGKLAGEPFHVIVCHWPSRRGTKSSDSREFAASITKHIADSIYNADKSAKIVIMGDLNDNPTDASCKEVLNAKRKRSEVEPGGLYNTMWNFYNRGIGSLAYQGQWSLFDQIIISHSLLGNNYSSLKFWKAEIFNRDFLHQKEGKNKGYPLRTFAGNMFLNGYSDHFPTLIYLIKNN